MASISISATTIESVNREVHDTWKMAFNKAVATTDDFAVTRPVGNPHVKDIFLTQFPSTRQWIGEKQIGNIPSALLSFDVVYWESTVGISRLTIEGDQLQAYAPLVSHLGSAGKKHKDQRVVELLQQGKSTVGFDGLAFFSTAHTLNPASTQANLFTSRALSSDNFALTYEAMVAYFGDDSRPLMVMPTHLVVPPQLMATGRQILETPGLAANLLFPGASANVWYNKNIGTYYNGVKLVVVPELANEPLNWYMAAVDGTNYPVAHYQFKAPSLISAVNPTDPNVFMRNEFLYSVETASVTGFGPWMFLTRNEG